MDRNPPPARGRARGRATGAVPPQATTAPSPPVTAQPPAPAPAQPQPTAPAPAVQAQTVTPTVRPTVTQPAAEPSTSTQLQKLQLGDEGRKPGYVYSVTKPANFIKQSPVGKDERTLKLLTNYFPANVPNTWAIHQYAVTFEPALDDEQTPQRKGLFRSIAPQHLPPYMFDGFVLFTTSELTDAQKTLHTKDRFTGGDVTITIDSHKAVEKEAPVCTQIYNIFVRRCLEHCKFTQFGRNYFDPNAKTAIPAHHLEVWPGFATSLRFYESKLLLNVEMVSKVIRTNSVLNVMNEIRGVHRMKPENEIRNQVESEVVTRTVLTAYNNRTYPIGGILWEERPTDHFPCRDGSTKSYVTYYKERYGIEIKDLKQPLLLVETKEREKRRMLKPKVVKLVPEICMATGLTDSMRANFHLMTEVGKIAHVQPTARVTGLNAFVRRFLANVNIKEEMTKWGIDVGNGLVGVTGRRLPEQKVWQGDKDFGLDGFSKGMGFRAKLHEPKDIVRWAALVPVRDEPDFQGKFMKDIQTVSKTMGFRLGAPRVYKISRPQGSEYLNQIENVLKDAGGKPPEMVFIVLPNNNPNLYSIVKQKLVKGYGLPSQCCLPKNLKKGLSVATKIAVQMCCKVGGVPWCIRNPYKENICVMGFDVYHGGATSIGAIVATTNMSLSRNCSFIKKHKHREEISLEMGNQIRDCLEAYFKINGVLPTKIFFYRDGVGEGQVEIVIEKELKLAKASIAQVYREKQAELPKLSYIIVSKRINSRFVHDVGNNRYDNPPPGTVVDDVVTLQYRYDFFLISQTARQGTVSPTNYNVIHNEIDLPPARLQTFTYRLCHNYYNWNGTLSVPSVCQNAHKLAYITGEAIKEACKDDLRYLPYYL